MKLTPIVGVLVVLVLAVGGGLYFGSCGHADTSVLSDSLATLRKTQAVTQSERDSLGGSLTVEQARTDSLTRVANGWNERYKRSALAMSAYRDSVRVLSSTLVAVRDSSGHTDTVTVPPQITAKMHADSLALDAANARADAWMADALAARKALSTATLALAKSDTAIRNEHAQAAIRESIAYAKGKAAGRREGFVIGGLTGVGVSGGVAVVALLRK